MVEETPDPVKGVFSAAPTGSSHHMPEPTGIPPWVQFILDDMNRQFGTTNQKIDKLVTQVEFRDEKSRVNDRLRDIEKDNAKNAADIQAEATARMNGEVARSAKERDEAQRQQATERQTRWQWFAIPAAAVAAYVVPWIANGGLSQP